MLRKVLIANRGEIACRVIRTARRLGIATVAVYSDADRRSRHVEEADEAVAIGPPPPAESYLRIDRILAAARETGAGAIHPGSGFLSESAAFSEACRAAGVVFVGPAPEAMRRLGDKAAAKALAEELGIPIVPGYRGAAQDIATLEREAARIGYPVMIKAAAGGGGRGMRAVTDPSGFAEAAASAAREARSAFGDGRLLLERLVERPRHIEVQVFADRHGNVVHLYERDCSLQRRHQKVVEEAPAPGIGPALRGSLTQAAVALARAAGYEGAGTIEFLANGAADGAPFYFIEANTRLQVEHPVTEEVCGLDLVEWQFRVASGEPLPLAQDRIAIVGHAVEARIYAEDATSDFLPAPGRVIECGFPEREGVRIETALRAGDEVTPYYDPMIAKVIARGASRTQALDRVRDALAACRIVGPATNAAFLDAVLEHSRVRSGEVDTELIGRELERLVPPGPDAAAVRIGVARLLALECSPVPDFGEIASPWQADDGFQLGGARRLAREVIVDGNETRVGLEWRAGGAPAGPLAAIAERGDTHVAVHGGKVYVLDGLVQTIVAWPAWDAGMSGAGEEVGAIRAPINGRITKLFIAEGARVEKGGRIGIVEAMKMEHGLHAARAGIVRRIAAAEGEIVAAGALIAELAEEEAT